MTDPARLDETLCDLEQRLREENEMCPRHKEGSKDCTFVQAADFIRDVLELCNERKWSVMVDESGRMEDCVLAVDILRLAAEDNNTRNGYGKAE